jgi:hypothetical protein
MHHVLMGWTYLDGIALCSTLRLGIIRVTQGLASDMLVL